MKNDLQNTFSEISEDKLRAGETFTNLSEIKV